MKSSGSLTTICAKASPRRAAQNRLPIAWRLRPRPSGSRARPRRANWSAEIGKVLFEPWFAARSCGDEDLERCERGRIAECVPAGVDNGLHTLARRTDRYFHIVDRLTQEFVAVVDHSHEHGVAIAEVILDDTPGHPGPFGDMAGGYRGEALFANASDRLVNDELTGTVASDLALHGSSRGSGPTGAAAHRESSSHESTYLRHWQSRAARRGQAARRTPPESR